MVGVVVSRTLAIVGLITIALFVLLLVGIWVLPRLALCMLFCWI